MMNKNKKKTYIQEMKDFFQKTNSVFVTHYQGLTVKQMDELRSEMRKNGILFKITKNKITKLALEGSKFKKLENLFSGPTAVALSEDAMVNSNKDLKYLVKESQTPRGLNEQGVKELKKAGFFRSSEKTLNSILKRLNKV